MSTTSLTLEVNSETKMELLGSRLANVLKSGLLINLTGDLGAGKTFLTRSIIKAMGHKGRIKSPTFTIVESYLDIQPNIYHLDLYRLADPQELEFIGIDDFLNKDNICFVEWPEKGHGVLPKADIDIAINFTKDDEQIRILSIKNNTPKACNIFKDFDCEL
jgi:tRNA threonylcarbamoyladenosine biosynthesis protein TsaE